MAPVKLHVQSVQVHVELCPHLMELEEGPALPNLGALGLVAILANALQVHYSIYSQ